MCTILKTATYGVAIIISALCCGREGCQEYDIVSNSHSHKCMLCKRGLPRIWHRAALFQTFIHISACCARGLPKKWCRTASCFCCRRTGCRLQVPPKFSRCSEDIRPGKHWLVWFNLLVLCVLCVHNVSFMSSHYLFHVFMTFAYCVCITFSFEVLT